DQPAGSVGQPEDPRSFPVSGAAFGPGPRATAVPPGQMWSFSSSVQLPFDAAQAVHLHADVSLVDDAYTNGGQAAAAAVRQFADVPLHLLAARPEQQLHLDLQADRRQWCLLAATPDGSAPAQA